MNKKVRSLKSKKSHVFLPAKGKEVRAWLRVGTIKPDMVLISSMMLRTWSK